MPIHVRCDCGRILKARDEFAGTRAECPYCGRKVTISAPEAVSAGGSAVSGSASSAPAADESAMEIEEFFDPPSAPPPKPPRQALTMQQMFEALLSPQSIHWMLILGGGLCVLGLLIYLTSLGLFKNPQVLAGAFIFGTLALLGTGWYLALKTKLHVAGRAITFLGCVVAPLNLWFWHAQGLADVGGNLWMGGLACCLLYIATVYVLRDPLFMYAVEVGVSLTVGLFLYSMGLLPTFDQSPPPATIAALVLGLISIHLVQAFAPAPAFPVVSGTDNGFTRDRFGMPLFYSGHVQLVVGLWILAVTQIAGWMFDSSRRLFDITWTGNLITHNQFVPAILWLIGAYAYVYSDLAVVRHRLFSVLAAVCLLAGFISLCYGLPLEWFIILLAGLSVGINLLATRADFATGESWQRSMSPIAIALALVAVLLGVSLHAQATSYIADLLSIRHATDWFFVTAMLVVAVTTRESAYLFRDRKSPLESAYFFLSAGSVVIGAAGILRMQGYNLWAEQAGFLMLIPIAYLTAAWLWRGKSPEEPLGRVAHAATALILLGTLEGAVELVSRYADRRENLIFGVVFLEATLFYCMAAIIRRRSVNVYFATVAACGAVWQFCSYADIPGAYYTVAYALLGTALQFAARSWGLTPTPLYRNDGTQTTVLRGKGLTIFQSANAVLGVALLTAFFQGLGRILADRSEWNTIVPLLLTTVAGAVGAIVVPHRGWRRAHFTGTIAVATIAFLTLVLKVNLAPWQKLEIFLTIVGVLLLIAGYVGRFRESTGHDDSLDLALWMGAFLASVPLLLAVFYHRYETGISLPDELTLITLGIAMLVTGFGWQVKAPTLLGGSTLGAYLLLVVLSVGYYAQWAVGAYLAIGGGLLFLCAVGLSVYRERLLALPETIARREGIFKIMDWR